MLKESKTTTKGKGAVKDNYASLMKIASMPDDWVTPENNEERGEPKNDTLNPPGNELLAHVDLASREFHEGRKSERQKEG